MSSLAEINQRLIENNKEQERTSRAIEDVRTAIQDQLKNETRSRLQAAEDRREAKTAARRRPQGFREGLLEGAGVAGLGRFGQSLLGALFGGLSGGALAGLAGLAAGKILKGAVLAGLLKTFGEDAIKAVFDKLKEKGIDFNLTEEQENEIAKRTTDGVFGAIIAGIVFKNPFVRLGAGIVAAYKDKIFKGVETVLGIKITNLGKEEGYKIDIPWLEESFKLDETWTTSIVGIVGGFFTYMGFKMLNGVRKLIKNTRTKVDDTVDKILAQKDAEIKKLTDEIENAKKQADLNSKIASSAPKASTFDVGDKVGYTRTDGTKVDATVTQKLPSGLTQLQFDKGGKIAVDTSKITVIDDGPKLSKLDRGTKIASGIANKLAIEGAIEDFSRYASGKTTGMTSKAFGGIAKVLGSTAGLAASFVMGGLFENEAGDGTLSGVIDANAYGLMQAMADGETVSSIEEKQRLLKKNLNDPLYKPHAESAHIALANLSPVELINLSRMVYAQANPGKLRRGVTNVSLRPLGSGRVGSERLPYGDELSALDAIAAQREAYGLNQNPVNVIDNKTIVNQGSKNSVVKLDQTVPSQDTAFFQRKLAMGLGF